MVSLADRVNVGIPTCMASTLYIAIGTSHGFILVFDSLQVRKRGLITYETVLNSSMVTTGFEMVVGRRQVRPRLWFSIGD